MKTERKKVAIKKTIENNDFDHKRNIAHNTQSVK